LNFSISIIAFLNKQKLIFLAEEKLGKLLEGHSKSLHSIDFKEVFKWITSPLIAQNLDKSPDLEGNFQIHCMFCLKDKDEYKQNCPEYYENEIMINLQKDIVENGFCYVQNKR
jgi:hypothetical protein